jgi:hypothetical protein
LHLQSPQPALKRRRNGRARRCVRLDQHAKEQAMKRLEQQLALAAAAVLASACTLALAVAVPLVLGAA